MNRALYAAPILVVVLAAGCTSSKKHAADATAAPSGSAASSGPASSAPASSTPASSAAVSSPVTSAPVSSAPATASPSTSASASASATALPSIVPAKALAAYTKAVDPSVAAISTVDHTLSTLSPSSTGPDVAKITFPIAGELSAAIKTLTTVVWPAEAAGNVRGVAVTFQALQADLEGVAGSETFDLSTFQPKFDADLAAATKELALAKAQLGGG